MVVSSQRIRCNELAKGRLINAFFIVTASILSLLSIPLSSEAGSLIGTAKESNGLIGPVRQTITKDRYSTTTNTYDHSGDLIEMVFDLHYDNIGRSHSVFTYDDRELPKEELGYAADGAVAFRKLFSFSFHENGKPAAMVAAMADSADNY